MKTMTCKQLGGACDKAFHANSFDEIAKISQQHGKEMFEQGDKAHIEAMNKMMKLDPEDMNEWFENKRKEFEALPVDK